MPGDSKTPFTQRSQAMEPFLAMEVMERAFEMERKGVDVVHLEIGEPHFAPPPLAVKACSEALSAGATHYTESRGLPQLREAIARQHTQRSGVEVSPEQVLVTNGTSPAMLLVFSLLVEEAGEVILSTPHYPCYPNFVRFCGGTPVLVPAKAEDGYAMDLAHVEQAITPRTRAILVASPANPTGAVQTAETLQGMGDLGLPLISDEIYNGLVYDGVRVTSALEVSQEAYVLDGFSKRYAMTGFRLGYVIAPRSAMRTLQVMQQNLFISANQFVQQAGVVALETGAETVSKARVSLEHSRGVLVEGLKKLGLGVPQMPAGGFQVFADARHLGRDSRKLSLEILEKGHVAVTPGIDFGEAGEGWLRFCFAAEEEEILEGLNRLESALGKLS